VKQFISRLNKAFESRARLGIMSILMVNDSLDFTRMKELLDMTDGNLASHLRALEDTGYVLMSKQFVGRKPNTTFAVTADGRRAFAEHLNGLEALIRSNGAETNPDNTKTKTTE
jgi:DNA-binding MarR family transcriptional regulator